MQENPHRVQGPESGGGRTQRWEPKGSAGRVAVAHRQAWPTLGLAAAFMAAAALVAVAAGAPRQWMALHLLLVGGVLSAISATTQMFAITWSAAPPPPGILVVLQRWVLALGAVALVVGRETELTGLAAAGGSAVIVALLLLAYLLAHIRSRVVVGRHLATIDGYLLALVVGIAGLALGLWMAVGSPSDPARMLDAHTTLNLFGLVGLVVAATVPSFIATQARTKMNRRYRPARARAVLGTMAGGVALAAMGMATGRTGLAAAGLVIVLLCMIATAALLPRLGRRQFGWAGPRLGQVVAALSWWIVALVWALVAVVDPGIGMQRGWLVLAVGGIAQLVVGSLAYLGPIMRGREHRGQQRAFAICRSWLSLVAGNLAAMAVAGGWWAIAAVAVAVWLVDFLVRAVLLVVLVRPRPAPLPSNG